MTLVERNGLHRIVELLIPNLCQLNNIRFSGDVNARGRSGAWNAYSRDDAPSLTNAESLEFVIKLVIDAS